MTSPCFGYIKCMIILSQESNISCCKTSLHRQTDAIFFNAMEHPLGVTWLKQRDITHCLVSFRFCGPSTNHAHMWYCMLAELTLMVIGMYIVLVEYYMCTLLNCLLHLYKYHHILNLRRIEMQYDNATWGNAREDKVAHWQQCARLFYRTVLHLNSAALLFIGSWKTRFSDSWDKIRKTLQRERYLKCRLQKCQTVSLRTNLLMAIYHECIPLASMSWFPKVN